MIRNFKKEDWYAITDPVEADAVSIEPDMLDIVERGIAITVEDDKGVVGCGGVVLYDEKNGEMWVRLSKRVGKFEAIEAICSGMKILKDAFSDVSLYCRVRQDFEKAHKLVKWLGFKPECFTDGYMVYRV